MASTNTTPDSGQKDDAKRLSPDKKADILHAMFQHHADAGQEHQRQAATTSNILLLVSGGILTLVGLDAALAGLGDALATLAVALIGGFGMVWSWKQHQAYAYSTNVAEQYQMVLSNFVSELKKARRLEKVARKVTADEYGTFVTGTLRIRYLWVALHGAVMLLGTVLTSILLWNAQAHTWAWVTGASLIGLMLLILIVVVRFRRPKAS